MTLFIHLLVIYVNENDHKAWFLIFLKQIYPEIGGLLRVGVILKDEFSSRSVIQIIHLRLRNTLCLKEFDGHNVLFFCSFQIMKLRNIVEEKRALCMIKTARPWWESNRSHKYVYPREHSRAQNVGPAEITIYSLEFLLQCTSTYNPIESNPQFVPSSFHYPILSYTGFSSLCTFV